MIEVEADGRVARIRLNAPDRHNALDRAALADLGAALDTVAASDARAMVLTGTGRSFCSGAALNDVASSDWSRNPLTEICARIEALPMPSVAALNGGVYGGGVDLALACDFRVGVEGMRMWIPAAELGIHYPADGLVRSERLLGLAMTRRIFLLAERFEAQALREAGFLDRLAPRDAFAAEVEALAGRLTALAPLAVQGMKRTLAELPSGADPVAVQRRIAACFASRDHVEGMAAQKARREPRFKGR